MHQGHRKSLLILILSLIVVACGEHTAVSEQQAIAQLKTHIDTLHSQDEFSGTVLLAKDKDILLHYTRGYFNKQENQPLRGDEKFRLGSLNKMFTSVAILKLVDEGKVALNATLDTYLPEFENQVLASSVTIHHLLTHSGGAGDIFGPEYDKHRLALKTHKDYVDLYQARKATQAAGKGFAYSNFGFILLGRVIEVVSGQSYYAYLNDNIFTPAGMHDTGFAPETAQVPNLTAGYMRQNNQWLSNRSTLPWRGTAAGGGYSTALDLLKFSIALKQGKLISNVMLHKASSHQVAMGDAGYGYGMGVFGEGSSRFYGHNGGAPGMSTWLAIYPISGYTVIVLSNYDPPVADEVQRIFSEHIPFRDS